MTAKRHMRIRVANADIAGSARLHRWDVLMPVPFLCECDDEECSAHVRLTLGQYDSIRSRHLFVTALEHRIESGSRIRETDGHGLHVVRTPYLAFGA